MMREINSVLGNSQRLDGGAMFGNAPKALWSRWVAPDDRNRIPLACRAMLVRDAGRTFLFEAGVGAFFEPKLKDRYGVVEPEHVLLASLSDLGLSDADVDVVVLSHLHFDHAGGLLSAYRDGESPTLLFPKARFVVGRRAWERACHPHPRDRASFVPDLQELLARSGRLDIVEGGEGGEDASAAGVLGEGYRFHFSDGHTPGLMLTEVAMPGGPVVYAGDLVPGTAWMHLPVTMGYDRNPELLVDEKRALLEGLLARAGRLFFTHDARTAMSSIGRDERGRFHPVDPQPEVRALRD